MKPNIFLLTLIFIGIFPILYVSTALGDLFLAQIREFSTFIKAIKDPAVLDAIWVSVSATTISTIIASATGIPLAYVLARADFPGKSVVEGILDIPVMIPHIVAGIALYGILNPSGLIGHPLRQIGFIFQDHFLGVTSAMLFMSFPFLIDSAKEGFKTVDPRLENVARSLGASHSTAFLKITFPLAFPSIFNGMLLCWARGISEFSAVLILAYFPKSAPILIWEKFSSYGLSASRPISVLLILICLLIFAILRIPRWSKT